MYQCGLYAGFVRKALALHVHHNGLFSGGRYTEANRAYEHHQSKVVYYQDCYFGFYSSGCVTLKIKSGFNSEGLRCNYHLNHCRKHCLMDNLMFSTTFDHNRVNNGGIWRGSFLPWSRHAECSKYSMNKQRNLAMRKIQLRLKMDSYKSI